MRVSYIAVSQVDAWKSLHPDINELWYDAGLMAITGISGNYVHPMYVYTC